MKDVAGSLPDVAESLETTPDRIIGEPLTDAMLQVLLEQGYCPLDGGIAQVLRRGLQDRLQTNPEVFGPQSGPSWSVFVNQSGWVMVAAVRLDPIVDAPRGHAEGMCDLGNRSTPIDLEDRQSATVNSCIVGRVQLVP